MLTLLLVYFETQENDANFHFCKWRGRIGFVSYQLITSQIACLRGFTGPFGRCLAWFVLTEGLRAAFFKVTAENTWGFRCPAETSGFQLSGAQCVEIYPLLGISAWAPHWNSLIISYPFYQILSLLRYSFCSESICAWELCWTHCNRVFAVAEVWVGIL